MSHGSRAVKNIQKHKHLFFDLDGTLARSRMPMTQGHARIFIELTRRFNVLVTSGTSASRIRKRLPDTPYYLFAENGNVAFDRDGELLWKNGLSASQKEAVFSLIGQMRRHLNLAVKDENDLVEDREMQIAYSLIGHNENLEKKEAFDPGGEKRRALLAISADGVRRLKNEGVQVLMGGTTSIDFVCGNKATNIMTLMKTMTWKSEDALYIGDALYPGGNDEVMVGVIETRPVRNPEETFAILSTLLIDP